LTRFESILTIPASAAFAKNAGGHIVPSTRNAAFKNNISCLLSAKLLFMKGFPRRILLGRKVLNFEFGSPTTIWRGKRILKNRCHGVTTVPPA